MSDYDDEDLTDADLHKQLIEARDKLRRELESLPAGGQLRIEPPASTIAVPMQLEVRGQVLSMISTTTVFGSPVDITLAELALEAFVPADDQTAHALREMAAG